MPRWKPKIWPRLDSVANVASIASRGEERMPLPSRSANRSARTCSHPPAMAMNGRTIDESPYPASTSGFGAPVRSAIRPETILRMLLAASATPSMTPSDIGPAPSTRVRNSGIRG